MKPLVSATAVALLMFAEVLTVTHPLDADAHTAGEPCKICLSVASFGGAADVHDAPLSLELAVVPPPAEHLGLVASRRSTTHTARGPPIAS